MMPTIRSFTNARNAVKFSGPPKACVLGMDEIPLIELAIAHVFM